LVAVNYPQTGHGATSTPEPRTDTTGHRSHASAWVLAIVLSVLAALLWIGPARVVTFADRMLDAYLEAQQTMIAATSNLNNAGRAEFAVLLRDGASADELRAAMADIDNVDFAREADLAGWVVVTTQPGNRSGLNELLELPQSRIVVPNRGLWICH
jgi:hypothetical protein